LHTNQSGTRSSQGTGSFISGCFCGAMRDFEPGADIFLAVKIHPELIYGLFFGSTMEWT
jgi:hypothetical protein